MSQRNFPTTPTTSSSVLASDNISDLIRELETLSFTDFEKHSARNGVDSESQQKLCSLLCRLHSPRVARQVGLANLETKVLAKTCPLTRDYFEGLSRDLRDFTNDVLLCQAVGCLESLSELMAFVLEEMKRLDPQETLRCVKSLPLTVLQVIKSCYQICADIGLSASPEALNAVAKSLVTSAQDLSSRVGAIYELIQVADLSDYSQFVDASFSAFEEAVEVTRPLDVKMFLKLTKIAIKFLLQQQTLAQELGHLEVILQFYFGNLVSSLSTFPLPVDIEAVPSLDRAFLDESRICQFLARVASQMVENLHSLLARQYFGKIVGFLDRTNLILTMGIDEDGPTSESQNLQRPAIPPLFIKELSTALRPSVYHISKSLLHDEPFQRSLLDSAVFDASSADNSNYCSRAFGRLVTLVDVMEQLGSLKSNEAIAMWIEPLSPNEPNLIETIFQCVDKCQPEMILPVRMPGPMHGGRAQRDASLYSILLHRMNYLLSQCSESAFDFIEPLLLRWALTGSGERGSASGVPGSGLGSPLCSALASDAICFIVRLAAPDVGWNLTMTTAELHERIVGKDGEIGQNGTMISCEGMNGLKNLLPRLFSFLSSSQRTEFRSRFPIKEHLDLWCLLQLKETPAATTEIFKVLTNDWILHCSDLSKFVTTLRRFRRVLSRLRGSDVSDFERIISRLVKTSLKLVEQADFIPALSTEILHLLNNALEVSRNCNGTSTTAKSVFGDEQLLTLLRWCNENVNSSSSATLAASSASTSPPFDYAASCLLLTLSSYSFDPDLNDCLLMEYLKLLTGLLKRQSKNEESVGFRVHDNDDDSFHPCVRLNCLRSVEKRALVASDTHVIAAYLLNDPTIRELACPFLERRKRIGDKTDFLGRLRKEVFAYHRRDRGEASVQAEEAVVADAATSELPKIESQSDFDLLPSKKVEAESMDFNLMDDDDEFFSQVIQSQSSKENSQDLNLRDNDVIELSSSQDNSQKSSSSVIAIETKTSSSGTAVESESGVAEERTQVVEAVSKDDDIFDEDDEESTPVHIPSSPSKSVVPKSPTTSEDDPTFDELIGTQAAIAEDAAAMQQLVDGAVKEVGEYAKTLASYCANLKDLLPDGKLPQSTRDQIQAFLGDLNQCL